MSSLNTPPHPDLFGDLEQPRSGSESTSKPPTSSKAARSASSAGSTAPPADSPLQPSAIPTTGNPAEHFLSDVEVAARYGVARPTVWRWVKSAPGFPAPKAITPGTTRWRRSDLVAFEAAIWHEDSKPRGKSGPSKKGPAR